MAGGENDGDKMQLHVWKRDWGLPSIDPNSLSVLVWSQCDALYAFDIVTLQL